MSQPALLLAIDGGQTSTKSLLATVDGTVLAAGLSGPSDHFHIEGGAEKNRQAIHGAIRSALDAADRGAEEVAAIGLGLTGAPPEGEQNPIVEEVVLEILPHLDSGRIIVEPDYKTNLAGASGGEPGVAVIAGGGCIAYGITRDSREAKSGGFGYLIGDEGSAFDIGLRAIAAACKASDARGPSTTLEALLRDYFGIEKMRDVIRIVYRAGFSRERISLLTPLVAEAGRDGDREAIRILREAAQEVALSALGVIRQLYAPVEAAIVYMTGGVFNAGDLVRKPFEEALSEGWPEARAKSPRFPPVIGAMILAARSAGTMIDDPWLRRIEATLSGD